MQGEPSGILLLPLPLRVLEGALRKGAGLGEGESKENGQARSGEGAGTQGGREKSSGAEKRGVESGQGRDADWRCGQNGEDNDRRQAGGAATIHGQAS